MHHGPITIALSKRKLIQSILICILFELLAIWMIGTAGEQSRFSPVLVVGISIFSMAFFAMILATAVRKLRDSQPGLLIDQHGITDNSASISIGQISWSDILGIDTLQISTSKFLLVYLDQPEKYMARAKNKIAARLMKVNMQTYGTPIALTANTLNCNFDTLQEMITAQMEKYTAPERLIGNL